MYIMLNANEPSDQTESDISEKFPLAQACKGPIIIHKWKPAKSEDKTI